MADEQLPRDGKAYIPGIGGASNVDGTSFVNAWFDPTTHRQLVQATISGTVTTTATFVYDEDTAHVDADPGAFILAVRNDTLAALAGTDGDYAPFQVNASGALYVAVDGSVTIADGGGSITVDNSDLSTIAGAISGTEMQVDVLSVIPGTGATNLGKARGSVVGATDTGVALLFEQRDAVTAASVDDGDYGLPTITKWREIRTSDQRAIDLQNLNDHTELTALGDDTANKADSTNHVFGTGSVTFDKVNGTANTVFAGLQDTIASIDAQELFESGGFVGTGCYLPSISDVVNVFLRIGTDSSNYNEWEWSADTLSAGQWMALRMSTATPTGVTGNGWDTSSITYVAFGVEFSAETDTLAGIIFDNVHMVSGRVTDATTDATITSSISSPNINLHKVGNKVVDTGAGNVGTGTQRIVIATDQAVLPISDNGGSITVDNAALTELAAAINSNELDINIASDSVGIGGGTQYTEDAVAASDPIGNAQILIREDSPVTVAADGDNVAQRGTQYGAAYTQIVDSSGNFVDSFGGSGGTAAADDADFTAGTTSGTPVMGVYESSPSSVTDGDMGMVGISQTRRLLVDANISDNGGAITVDGTITANLSATDNAVLDAIDSNTDYGASTGGGTESGVLRVTIASDSTGVLSVDDNGSTLSIDDGGGAITVDGTVAVSSITTSITPGTGASNLGKAEDAAHSSGDVGVMMLGVRNTGNATLSGTALDYTPIGLNAEGSPRVTGDRAHDAVDANNPIKIGGRAQAPTASLEEVADNDRVDAAFDRQGRLAVWMGYPVQSAAINTATSGNNTIVAAAGAGKRIAVMGFSIISDGTVDARWEDGANGTAKTGQYPFQAREGIVRNGGLQPIFVGSANTLLNLELSAAINVHGEVSYVVMED